MRIIGKSLLKPPGGGPPISSIENANRPKLLLVIIGGMECYVAFHVKRTGAATAEAVANKVGYASASQFSREYARVYGEPRRRDAERARSLLISGAFCSIGSCLHNHRLHPRAS